MTRTTAIAAGLLLSISLLNAQEVMTLKDCMEYAVNNSAKSKYSKRTSTTQGLHEGMQS